MGAYIWFELKRKICQPKTWFLMVLIFILSFQKVVDYNEKSLTYPSPESRFDIRGKHMVSKANRLLDHYKDGSGKSKRSAELLLNTGTQIRIAAVEENYDECKRLISFGTLLQSKAAVQKFGGLREESFRIRSMKIWNEVSNGIDYEEVDFELGDPMTLRGYSDTFLADSQYNHILYRDNLHPIGIYHMDSMTFLYHYFNEIIPMLIGFIILILVFDSINEEWSNGSLKLILTQPFSRNKYLTSKIIIGTLQALFTILIPAIIISTGYGIVNGFGNYNYPVIHIKKGLQNFKSLPNYLERDMGINGYNDYFGISIFSHVVEITAGFSKKLGFIPLYKFLFMVLLLLIFVTIFYVVLNIFISSITKNKIIAFSASGLITLIGTVVSNRLTIGDRYNLSPFTMNNPVRILNGTYNATALMALMVLTVSIILIYLTNLIYFRRKDL